MSKPLNEKTLILNNFIIVAYFGLIYIINFYKIENKVIDVFREILTLPFLIAQLIFLILGCIFLIKNKKTLLLTKISVILLAISAIITIGSFF